MKPATYRSIGEATCVLSIIGLIILALMGSWNLYKSVAIANDIEYCAKKYSDLFRDGTYKFSECVHEKLRWKFY